MADTLLDAESYVAEFKGSGLLFEQALAQADMAVCITDPRLPDNPIVFANEAFLNITGYRLTEVLGRNCRFLQGAGTNQEHIQRLRDALKNETSILVELQNYRKDGTPFWNALHVGPIFNEAGELIYFFGSQMDVSEVHDAREQPERRGTALSGRVKSFLSSFAKVFTPETQKAASAHHVAMNKVVDHILSAYHEGRPGSYSTGGPHVSVAEEDVGAIGLCLHELASRAVRAGVWQPEAGNVAIRWSEPVDDCLRVEWIEDRGPDATSPVEVTPVLETIVDSLGGSYERSEHPSGQTVVLNLPLGTKARC